jgi:HlyD family secretion protein
MVYITVGIFKERIMKNKKFLRIGIIASAAAIIVLISLALLGVFNGKQTDSAYQVEAAKVGDISVSVGGTGTVRANQTANLTWDTSGKVSDIYVKKGQQVIEDEVLAELDSTSLSQSIILAQVDLINAKDALDKAINNTEARADAHLALIQAEQALEDAQDEADSKLYQRASQETIDIARANLITANQALDDAEELYNRTKGAGEDSLVYAAGLTQYAQARQEQTRAEYNLRYVQDLPDALSVEEVNAKLEQVKAQYLSAKEEWEKVKDGPNEEDIQAAQAKVDSAQAALNMAQIEAPFAGTITDIINKPGDLVTAGSKAFQVDDISRLLVDVDISEVDINQIEIGQQVDMTFDAISGQDFTGTVSDVSMYGTNNSGSIEFSITVAIDNPIAEIKPGMTAAVNVVVKELSEVLLVPSRAVRTVNGKRVVYVLQNNIPMPVTITLGASADSYSQILSGEISKGDQIVLNPPDMSAFGPGMQGGN